MVSIETSGRRSRSSLAQTVSAGVVHVIRLRPACARPAGSRSPRRSAAARAPSASSRTGRRCSCRRRRTCGCRDGPSRRADRRRRRPRDRRPAPDRWTCCSVALRWSMVITRKSFLNSSAMLITARRPHRPYASSSRRRASPAAGSLGRSRRRDAGNRQAPERRDQGQRRLHAAPRRPLSVPRHLGPARSACSIAWGFERCLWGTDLDARLRRRQLSSRRSSRSVETKAPERLRAGDADGRRLRQGLLAGRREQITLRSLPS